MRVRTLLAPNPGPYTGPGTNTYLVDDAGEALVLDPGPRIDSHAAEIVAAAQGLTVVAVVATHTHPDHAPLANPLGEVFDVPVLGYGPGPAFIPDRTIGDGDDITVGTKDLTAVHTPGHTADHLCFRLDDRLFTGDHIMGGSTVVIEDASAYMESLYRVRDLGVTRIDPGHGAAIDDAAAVIEEYIDHRKSREQQLLQAVSAGAGTVPDLVTAVYGELPEPLLVAAAHQVRVQLDKLSREGLVLLVPGGAGTEDRVEPTR